MGSGSSKRSAQIVAADERLNYNHTNSNAEGTVEHKGKPSNSQNVESQNGGMEDKSLLNNTNTVALRTLTKDEDITQDVDVESNPLLTSFSEKNPQIEPRLIAAEKHYRALKEALDSGNLTTTAALEHAKALIDVYLKCKKRSNRTVVTDFAIALGMVKLFYEIIVDRRTTLPEVTTWDRKPRKEIEKEQDEGNEDTQANDENQNQDVTSLDRQPTNEGEIQEKIQEQVNDDTPASADNQNQEGTTYDKVGEIQEKIPQQEMNGDTPANVENQNQEVTIQNRQLPGERDIQGEIQGEVSDDTPESTENQESKYDEEKISALKMSQDLINHLLAVLLNFSDLHDEFCLACNEVGMVQLFVDMSKHLQDSVPYHVKFVNPKTQYLSKYTSRGKMLNRILGNLHNLSKRVPTRTSFAACQAVNVLIPLLKADVALFSAKSLLVLACLIDEENNHLIMADEEPIKFLTSILKKAIGSSTHRYLGLSAAELAEGLTQIAVNDNNKKTIAQCGAIPILVKMLQNAKGDEERLNACNTLWTLAFDKENKNEICSDDYAIFELRKLLTSENSEIKRAAAGALWECEGKEKHAEGKQQSVTLQQVTGTKHVMISYQWDVQRLVIQMKNKLQADGYKVWMDIDEMGGSTLESMASAVENASVVLVCVSQKYKESPNCRSEAEYTFQLHKDIIPLMMDHKYRPDGWLGFIVGSKFWIDFSEKYKLDSSSDKLVKELGNRGKLAVQETTVQDVGIKPAVVVDDVNASPQSSIRSWTWSDVTSWLKDVGLEDRLDPKAVQRLDGQMLMRLQDLRKETSPDFFYSSIRSEFKLESLFDLLEFTDALEKLEG
ncbi:hypothetical protein OS493_007137 [Desmophyllum pertusum]|uniref:TIR domain-containing protein n=1 Tax=Desmophyllum pertusum TaxID=174260 RepID=A0A9X0D0X8_9CNID|nr:hypothetical protein OS493_007137 [Desmophyllum pertusum]